MTSVHPPEARVCERCDRAEVWSEQRETWVATDDDSRGHPHCLHDWDIPGKYNPIRP